jgi:hypothetical protein
MVIGLIALTFLLAAYAVYQQAFSHLSLVPLDPGYLPPAPLPIGGPEMDGSPSSDFARSVAAEVFGKDSWQAEADIVLYWRTHGVVIYVADYKQVDPQRFELVPFSLVYADRSKAAEAKPQYVTLEGEQATLEFDRAIDLIQVGGARPVGGRISGDVRIQMDRGTAEPEDDIAAYVDYLEFNESRQQIWTNGPVRIVAPDVVATGQGGEIHLEPLDDSRRPADKPGFQGVRDVVLLKDVAVHMVAAAGGFAPGAKPADATGKAAKKVPVTVTCDGPFVYDFAGSTARFLRNVRMVREMGESRADRMFCDELTGRFEPQQAGDAAKSAPRPGQPPLAFRAAHATGNPVRIYSDAQAVEAAGVELHHDAATGQSVLRGDPEFLATQAGNVVHGRELQIIPTPDNQRSIVAHGPGRIEAHDKQSGTVTLQARWTEWGRLDPRDGQQVLMLKGEVEAELPNRVTLQSDRLKLWIAPVHGSRANEPGSSTLASSFVPSRIEAIERVLAKSEQFDIEAADRLQIVFEDSPAAAADQAASAADGAAAKAGKSARGPRTADAGGTRDAADADPAIGPALVPASPNRQPARLVAQNVRVKALRAGTTADVSEVWTEGGVHLVQPPEEPGGAGNVVRGENLYLKRIGSGHHIEVTGAPAQIQIKDLSVEGPMVAVDQPSGAAWVEGRGVMVMPSSTDLDGQALQTPIEMSIRWGSSMFFDGAVADFGGGVEARQGSSTLRCRRLEAFLVERINISDPKKKDRDAARIASLVCRDAVQLDKIARVDGRLERYEHIESTLLKFNNLDGQMEAIGPGLLRSYAHQQGGAGFQPAMLGGGQPAAGDKPPANQAKDEPHLYVTEIRFAERMDANQRVREARFYGHVNVLHAPVADENETVDLNAMPPGGVRLGCEELEVGTKDSTAGQPYNVMIGSGNVDVEAREFHGRADRISYNQLYDRLIFESHPGSFARLFRQKRQGEKWDEFRGRKIWYYRREDRVRVEDGTALDFLDPQADQKAKPKAGSRR